MTQKIQLSTRGSFELLCEEGIVPAPYLDIADVWTFGAGHTASAGDPDPKSILTGNPMGSDYDDVMPFVLDVFARDITRYEQDVRDAVEVEMTQTEFDAMVLFHYNTGAIGKASGTKRFNEGKPEEAAQRFRLYNKAGGKRSEALANRRKRESRLLLDGEYSGTKIAVHAVTDENRPTAKPVRTLSYEEFLTLGHKEEDVPEPGGLLNVAAQPVSPPAQPDEKFDTKDLMRTIKQGSKGADVKVLQLKLHLLGYGLRKTDVDGIFGKQTAMAVVSWQIAADEPPTGIMTPWQLKTILETNIRKPVPLHRDEADYVKKEVANDAMAKDAGKSMKVGAGMAAGGAAIGVADVSGVIKSLGTDNVGMIVRFVEDNAWIFAIGMGLFMIWLSRRQIAAFVDQYRKGH